MGSFHQLVTLQRIGSATLIPPRILTFILNVTWQCLLCVNEYLIKLDLLKLSQTFFRLELSGNVIDTVLCKSNESEIRQISLRRPRIYVESNEILLSSWWNFASTEAKFCLSENSHPRNSARAKIPTREILPERKFETVACARIMADVPSTMSH